MTTNELSGQERTDDEPTTDERRAQWERFTMVVLDGKGGGYVNVRNDSHDDANDHIHSVHVEDGRADGCSCPHAVYRDAHCKHQRAVEQRPLVLASADAASATPATTGRQVATDGGTEQVTHTDDTQTTATDDENRPQTDYWGNAVAHYDNGPVGAGERRQCQACGSRFEVALISGTKNCSNQNWEEFYRCEICGARGSFRFYGEIDKREWTGRIAYLDENR